MAPLLPCLQEQVCPKLRTCHLRDSFWGWILKLELGSVNMQICLLSVFVTAWSTYSPSHKTLLSSLPHELDACVRRHSIEWHRCHVCLRMLGWKIIIIHLLTSTRPPQTQVPPERGTQLPCKAPSLGWGLLSTTPTIKVLIGLANGSSLLFSVSCKM